MLIAGGYFMRFKHFPKTVCVLVTLGFLSPLSAVELTVNDVSDMVDADLEDLVCKTASGTCTLRAAVQQANKLPGTDSIIVPDGTYELTLGKELAVTSNVRIQGSGADKVVISGKNSSRVFGIKSGGSAIISGITVTQGKAYNGAGIGVWGSSKLSLVDSILMGNTSTNHGAGLFISVSKVTLDNTTISGNGADGSGGAIYIEGKGSVLAVYESSFEQNSAVSGGGLFCNAAGNVYLENAVFDSNSSGGSTTVAGGGAIYNKQCSISLNQITFDQNSAEKRGGALFNASKGSFSIVNSTFSNNRAVKEDGGAIYSDGSLDINRASLTGNSATYGSALYDAGIATLVMVTVSDNQAKSGDGGAIYHNSNQNLVLKNSTVAYNSGGNLNNALGALQISNSLVANAAAGADCMGTITSSGYNLDSDGSCALNGEGDIASANPLLLALQDNGGLTLTREPGAGSPAINAGSPSDCPVLDQRYYSRPDRCDIGALESGGMPVQSGSIAFKQPVDMVRESTGVATITLTRSMGSDGPVSVHYQDDPFSVARSGFDFVDFDGVLEWADGEIGDKSFQIQILLDAQSERIEPLKIVLGNPGGGVAIGADRTMILNIVEDGIQFGELAFDSASYTVNENGGSLEVTVKRSNGDAGEVSVTYATADKEATAGKDYTAVSGTLRFADGETSKTINIPIMNDSEDESDETFVLQLSNVTGGAVEGAYNSAVVTIMDDDKTSSGGGTSGDDKADSSGDTTGTTSASSSKGGGGSMHLLLLVLMGSLFVRRRCADESA